jgi:hypothetical protein
MEKIATKVKTRRIGNDSFSAKISFNVKNRLQGVLFSRVEEREGKEKEQLFIKDKEELANLRSLLFRTSNVLAKRVPYDYKGPEN